MPEPTLHLYGDKGMEFMLRGVRLRGSVNIKPGLTAVGNAMLEAEEELFQTSGASGREPWEPLEDSTVNRKVRSGSPFPFMPLIEHGDLMLSLSRKHHPQNIFNVTRTSVFIGTRDNKATFHINGFIHQSDRPIARTPARPPIQFTERDEQRFIRILGNWIFHEAAHA